MHRLVEVATLSRLVSYAISQCFVFLRRQSWISSKCSTLVWIYFQCTPLYHFMWHLSNSFKACLVAELVRLPGFIRQLRSGDKGSIRGRLSLRSLRGQWNTKQLIYNGWLLSVCLLCTARSLVLGKACGHKNIHQLHNTIIIHFNGAMKLLLFELTDNFRQIHLAVWIDRQTNK